MTCLTFATAEPKLLGRTNLTVSSNLDWMFASSDHKTPKFPRQKLHWSGSNWNPGASGLACLGLQMFSFSPGDIAVDPDIDNDLDCSAETVILRRTPSLEASFDHEGISPHRICERCLVGSVGFCRITGTGCVGATLYRGIQSSASEIASKCSAIICLRLESR